jgi:hypothetical protein
MSELEIQVKFDPPPPQFINKDQMQGDANRELEAAMQASVKIVRDSVFGYTPFAFGTLRNSITGQVVFLAGNEIQGIIGTPVPYAPAVELGSKPHWPPLAPLELWVRRKLGGSGSSLHSQARSLAAATRKQGVKGYRTVDAKEQLIYATARAIQRKIARRGTDARQMFRKGFNETQGTVARIFNDALDRIRDLWASH